MGIAPTHVRDEFNLLRGVLIGIVMRPSGRVSKIKCAFAFPIEI